MLWLTVTVSVSRDRKVLKDFSFDYLISSVER